MLFLRSISGLVVFFGWALSIFAVGAQAEPVKVRMHQAWITGGKYAPMYVALEKGWYAKRNLSPVISRGYGSGRESKTLWKKQSDFAFEVDSTVMIRARDQASRNGLREVPHHDGIRYQPQDRKTERPDRQGVGGQESRIFSGVGP